MKKNLVIRSVSIAFAMAFSHVAEAGNTTGAIALLQLNVANNIALLTFATGTNSALPACSTAGNRYAVDISTNAGKAIYAGLLTAKMTNSNITAIGTNTCTNDPASENISQAQF